MLEKDIIRKINFLEIKNKLEKLPGIHIIQKKDEIVGIYFIKSGFYKNKIFVFRYTEELFIYPKVDVRGNNLSEMLLCLIEFVGRFKDRKLYKKLKAFKRAIFECIKPQK